jgi:tRNA(fMet)-specific endonuclease VapC
VSSYLLDTSICIELIREKRPGVLQRLRQCQIGSVAISSITMAELRYGVAKSRDPLRNRVAMAHFCAALEIRPFDDRAAGFYGPLRAALEQEGTPIGPLDTLIAAHALALDATLVTSNQREFSRVEGLRVENWAVS